MADPTQQFTPEQIAEFQAYDNQLADKTHAEGATAMYPAIGGAAGATVGAAIGTGNALVKGKNAAKELIAAAKAPVASVVVEGAPLTSGDKWAKAIGGPGGVNQDIAVQNRAMQKRLTPKEAAEFKVAREGIIVPNKTAVSLEKEAAAAEAAAAEAAAAKAKTIPARVAKGVEALGPIAPILGKGLALGSAGYDVGDVIDRSNKGQYGRGIVSGLGAIGSAATLAPNPIVKGLGMGVSLGAPMLNMYLDKKAQEHPEFFEKYNLAKGGTVPNLDTQTMAREILNHHLESKKPKPTPALKRKKHTIYTLPAGLSKEEFMYLCNGGHVEY